MPLAYINFDEYIKKLNEERDILNKDLNKALKDIEKRPENKKAHNKRDNLQQQLDDEKRLKKVKRLQNKNMVMNYLSLLVSSSSIHLKLFIMLVVHQMHSVILPASYAVQWEMINYALNHGIDRYNFYGVSGKFTEDAEDAGVVKFKKGYNAEIIEYVGDFIKPINKPVYAAYTALKKVKDRIF
ncbi:peptidoglycan bridge formation glycyltransferase FemA/FemB family protein [Staphylococcus aureus]